MQSWTWVHFADPIHSNPIHELMDPIQSNLTWMFTTYIKSNRIHKYPVLNRTRKLFATNYSNADF